MDVTVLERDEGVDRAPLVLHVHPESVESIQLVRRAGELRVRGVLVGDCDVAATLRFDLNAHWLLKLEGHVMRGTAALDNRALNGGAERKDLEATWGVFLLKTTAYF